MITKAFSSVENDVYKHLLIAEFSKFSYANAIIVYISKFGHSRVVVPHHVASGSPIIGFSDRSGSGYFTFWQVEKRDLAISHQPLPGSGFKKIERPGVNKELLIYGHHGSNREHFEIEAKVVRIENDGRFVVKRTGETEFQVGMSGSPAINSRNALIGVLVGGDHKNNYEFYFEPAIVLL